MILPTAYKSITTDLCDYKVNGFERIYTLDNYHKLLKSLHSEETLFICSMGYKWEYRKVFQALKKEKFHFCYFMQELSPADMAYTCRNLKEKLNIENVRKAVTRRIPKSLHGVKNCDFILGCGSDDEAIAYYKAARLCDANCPIYYFHSSNYEECLMSVNKPRLIKEKYCVFIDQFLPYHPDSIEAGVHFNAEDYFNNMNLLFDFIEKQYDIEVIIAAHPRSNYDLYPDVFEKRTIIKNDTCNLVKDSEFVIYHFSDSLAYVTAFKKPVIVITTNDINRVMHDSIMRICSLLGTTEVNLDEFKHDDNKKEIINSRLSINEEIYEEYIKKYMKKDYAGIIEGDALWVQIGKFLAKIGSKA